MMAGVLAPGLGAFGLLWPVLFYHYSAVAPGALGLLGAVLVLGRWRVFSVWVFGGSAALLALSPPGAAALATMGPCTKLLGWYWPCGVRKVKRFWVLFFKGME